MSSPDIALRGLRDARRALLAWVPAVGLLAFGMAAAFPAVRDQAGELTELIESYPDAVKAFFDLSGADYGSGPGYLNGEVFSFTAPVLLLVLAIGRGASSIAGEEDRGTLELLLSAPVRRSRVVLEKALALVGVVLVVSAGLWGSLVAASAAFGLGVGPLRMAGAVLMAALLAVAFGCVALMLGAATGRRGLAIGVATGLAVATSVLESLGHIVSALEPYRWVSPFAYYRDAEPLTGAFPVVEPLVLLLVAAAAVAAGVVTFARRDVSGR